MQTDVTLVGQCHAAADSEASTMEKGICIILQGPLAPGLMHALHYSYIFLCMCQR